MVSHDERADSGQVDVKNHLVITAHGIRTFGRWQSRLEALLKERSDQIVVQSVDYGWFSVLAFLFPVARWLATRRIRQLLSAAFAEKTWRRIDIVTHSFGTHLVTFALRDMRARERKQVHTLILAGSVLRQRLRWQKWLDGAVYRVINECGTSDFILIASQLFVLFTGMAGRVGFRGKLGTRLRNRYFAFGHSGYFEKAGFMERWWLPLILTDGDVEAHDERKQGNFAGWLTWTADRAEPFKLAAYALILYLVVLSFVAPRVTLGYHRDMDQLVQGSKHAHQNHSDDIAALLALEARRLNKEHDLARTDEVEETLRRAFDVSPFSHVLHRPAPAMSVAVSLDGRYLVAGWGDGSISCVDLDLRGGRPRLLQAGSRTIRAVTFEPRSHRFAAGADDGSIWMGDASADIPRAVRVDREGEQPAFPEPVRSLSFQAGGRLIAAGTESNAYSWSLRPSEPARVFASGAIGYRVAFSPDGEWLVAAAGRELVLVRGAGEAREQTTRWELPEANEVLTAVAFSRDSLVLATASYVAHDPMRGSRHGRVRRWVPTSPDKSLTLLEHDAEITSLSFGGENWIAAGCADKTVLLGEIAASGAVVERQILPGHTGAVTSTAVTADGLRVVSAGGTDESVRLWDRVAALSAPLRLPPAGGTASSLAASGPRGRRLVMAIRGSLIVWDLDTPSAEPLLVAESDPFEDRGDVVSVAARPPEGTIVATGSDTGIVQDGKVRLWDLTASRIEEKVLGEHKAAVLDVAFSEDGRLLASVGEQEAVCIWNMESGGAGWLAESDLGGRPEAASFGPGNQLAVGCHNGRVCVLDAGSEAPVCTARLDPMAGTLAGTAPPLERVVGHLDADGPWVGASGPWHDLGPSHCVAEELEAVGEQRGG